MKNIQVHRSSRRTTRRYIMIHPEVFLVAVLKFIGATASAKHQVTPVARQPAETDPAASQRGPAAAALDCIISFVVVLECPAFDD